MIYCVKTIVNIKNHCSVYDSYELKKKSKKCVKNYDKLHNWKQKPHREHMNSL